MIITRRGDEFIAFPGAGGYQIERSPGTKLLPMTPAPSGHLVVHCDHFDEVQPGADASSSYVTDHSRVWSNCAAAPCHAQESAQGKLDASEAGTTIEFNCLHCG